MSTIWRRAILVASALLAAVALGCGGGDRSQAAFCEALDRRAASLDERTATAGDGLGAQLTVILANLGEFRDLLADLANTAPEEIQDDARKVSEAFGKATGKAADSDASSLGGAWMQALSGGIGSAMSILMESPSFERVEAYARQHCGRGVFT